MKCEHGNEVRVIIEALSPPFWDDGVAFVDKDGKYDTRMSLGNQIHLRVSCPLCKTIKVNL